MRQKYCTLILLFLLFFMPGAAIPSTLQGVVMDAQTGERLAWANLYVEGTYMGFSVRPIGMSF